MPNYPLTKQCISSMKIRHTYKLLLILTIPLLLQSCFVAKNYSRPEIETENLYRTDNLPQDSVSMADVSWRDLFNDEQLKSYIQQGLENNIDIRIALQNVMAAEAYVKQGRQGIIQPYLEQPVLQEQKLAKQSVW